MLYGLRLLPVVLPILFWNIYHYHKDRHLPEPVSSLVLAFGLGLLSSAISRRLYTALGWASLRYDAIVLVFWHRELDEPIDGIICASFVALGYAAVENVIYLGFLTHYEAAARGFAGPVVHMLFASIWGFTIGCTRIRGESILHPMTGGFLVAAGLYGLYDFIVLQQSLNALPIAALLVVGGWVWRLRLMHRLHESAAPRGAECLPVIVWIEASMVVGRGLVALELQLVQRIRLAQQVAAPLLDLCKSQRHIRSRQRLVS